MTLSEALRQFIAANAGHYSWDVWNPAGDDSDSYQYSLNTFDTDELDRMTSLIAAFIAGWRLRRAAEEDENRNSITLRNIIAR